MQQAAAREGLAAEAVDAGNGNAKGSGEEQAAFPASIGESEAAAAAERRAELAARVADLKRDLADWRTRLDSQVTGYRSELSTLRESLGGEVNALKAEFAELRSTLTAQLELSTQLAATDKKREAEGIAEV
eukprot:jgi/Chlat1/1932/Chrsp153S02253